MFKVHVLYELKEGPWGGGNQFLKALKNAFVSMGIYADNLDEADCILFNSHHKFDAVLKMKKKYPNKIFVHRIDGPVFLIRNKDLWIDRDIFYFNHIVADISVFQSLWSLDHSKKLGYKSNLFEKVIYNASDPNIFNTQGSKQQIKDKVRLIATSWSANVRKGFEIYKYLDENLDFGKYAFTFVGNSPVEFKNIRHIDPVNSCDLAVLLKQHNIFITASIKDPCSNSLIEALNCGLPAVVMDDGGHPELVGKGGETFNSTEDVINKIETVVANYDLYKKGIITRNILDAAQKYYDIIAEVHKKVSSGSYIPRRLSSYDRLSWKIVSMLNKWRY